MNKARIVITDRRYHLFPPVVPPSPRAAVCDQGCAIRDGAIRDAVWCVRRRSSTVAMALRSRSPSSAKSSGQRRSPRASCAASSAFKLRAANTCNVIYVMWQVGGGRLAVAGENQPGARTRTPTADRAATRTLAPALARAVPALALGASPCAGRPHRGRRARRDGRWRRSLAWRAAGRRGRARRPDRAAHRQQDARR